MPKLEAVPGVARVAHMQWFGGVWQENTPLFVFAVDPVRQHDVYPEWVMPEAQWKAFANTRTAMIAGRNVANQYGWKIGQKVPIRSNIYPQKDGSKAWAFDLVGIYDGSDENWQKQTNTVFISHDYFDEANQFSSGRTNFFMLKLAPGADGAKISSTVDKMFENSPDETKTQTEKDFNVGFIKQIGDIGMIVRWILFAVFFTLLLVVGNTMAQSVRERIPGTGGAQDAGLLRRHRARFRPGRSRGAVPVRRHGRHGARDAVRGDGLEGHRRAVRVERQRLGVDDRADRDRADEPGRGPAAGAARAPPEDRRRIGRTLRRTPC